MTPVTAMTDSVEEVSLLPCPFCGYALPLDEGLCVANLDEFGDEMAESEWRYTGVSCANCAAYFPSDGSSRTAAIAAWNRRSTREASGDWVDTLRAEIGEPEEWKAKHDELAGWTGSAWLAGETDEDLRGDLYNDLCGLLGYLQCGEEVARIIHSAASPALPAEKDGAVQVGVKPLEWQPVHGEGVETYEANSILPGSYRVFVDEDSAAGAIFAEWAAEPDHFCMTYATHLGRFHSWDAAKAAAQQDFNARILSCLEGSA